MRQMALVEQKLLSGKTRKPQLWRHSCQQKVQLAGPVIPLGASQRDVRTVRPRLSFKSAGCGRYRHLALERGQLRAGLHLNTKDACSFKDAKAAELNWNRRASYLVQPIHKALVLLFGCAAQKLQRDVP